MKKQGKKKGDETFEAEELPMQYNMNVQFNVIAGSNHKLKGQQNTSRKGEDIEDIVPVDQLASF